MYNAIVVYEAHKVKGNLQINDDEGTELRYFSLKEPIPEMNVMARTILRKSGYITW
ncbi:hypothetical protein J2Z47_002901 [Cohnella thailandensis]|nr:hypothetical protein [Cohnella thailandensis]